MEKYFIINKITIFYNSYLTYICLYLDLYCLSRRTRRRKIMAVGKKYKLRSMEYKILLCILFYDSHNGILNFNYYLFTNKN